MMRSVLLLVGVLIGFCFLSSCGDDDVILEYTGEEEEFPLFEVGGSGIEGTVRFKEREDGAVQVVLMTTGAGSGPHPAGIYTNTAASGGNKIITLNPLENGLSETLIMSETDAGDAITYDELISLNGHVKIFESDGNMTAIAEGDLGSNVLTGDAEFYQLFTQEDEPEPNATVAIKERENGSALIEITYTGTSLGSNDVHLHMGTAAIGGGTVMVTLNDLDDSGRSITDVSETDDGNDLMYADLVDINGYIDIHTSGDRIAAGDIGGNEFTGEESDEYDLEQVNSSGIVGVVRFYERKNGSFLVLLKTGGTTLGSSYPAHIHYNSAEEGGTIAVPLSNVVNNISLTEVNELSDGTPITFNEILTFDGHVNVHLSAAQMDILVAQGDIGSNN